MYLAYGSMGKPGTVQRMSRKAGIEGQISPHNLRYSFATIALENGAALHDVQDGLVTPTSAPRAATTGHEAIWPIPSDKTWPGP